MAQKPNPHDSLFRAADGAKRAFDKRKGAQLRQNARSAQQAKNWALAESLWRKSLDEEPGERAAIAGLAQVLVYNGKFDEAKALADRIVAAWPNDENGATVLARLAEEAGDTAGAIAQWRRVLELAPGRSQALIRLGRLLIAERDFAGARGCADHLALYAPDNPAAISLLAEMAAAEGDLAGAVARRKELTEKFPHQAALWRDYGTALVAARDFEACEALIAKLRNSDPQGSVRLEGQLLRGREPEMGHSAFWKAAHEAWPDNSDFLRKYLDAALRDGKREDARGALDRLFESTLLRASDVNFVIGLVNLSQDPGEIRGLVRRFLRQFRGTSDYRRLALRLSRVIYAHFGHGAPRTRAMLSRTQCDAGAREFLESAMDAFERLGVRQDTDISPAQCEDFVALVRARLAAKMPWSFIRAGDGESNAFADVRETDAVEREHVWWGRPIAPEDRARLGRRVLEAMRDADALGIPTLERLLRDVRLERREYLSNGRAGRGLRRVMAALEDGTLVDVGARQARDAPLLTSAHLQHDLEKCNLYGRLFEGLDDVIAVSCHASLPFATNILIPPRHASLAAFGRTMGPKILPEVLDEVIAQLPGDLAGRLVVVGAGYAGKVIIHEAKKRGAVALDLGSIFDYWAGAATRSYLTAASSTSPLWGGRKI